jgi:hypothetical protein
MNFDDAVKALSAERWDWSKVGFENALARLGFERQAKTSADMPIYATPWGEKMQVWFEDGRATRAELMFDATVPEEEFDPDEYDDLEVSYRKKWKDYVARATKLLGKPKFADGMAKRGFPKDLEAQWLALWPLETARFMVIQNNGEHDIPFWMGILLTPVTPSR